MDIGIENSAIRKNGNVNGKKVNGQKSFPYTSTSYPSQNQLHLTMIWPNRASSQWGS